MTKFNVDKTMLPDKMVTRTSYHCGHSEFMAYANALVCTQSVSCKGFPFHWMPAIIQIEKKELQFGKATTIAELVYLERDGIIRTCKTEHITSICSMNCYVKKEDSLEVALAHTEKTAWHDLLKKDLEDELISFFQS